MDQQAQAAVTQAVAEPEQQKTTSEQRLTSGDGSQRFSTATLSKPSTARSIKQTQLTTERQKKIRAVFALFDNGSNGTCDVREVGTILRSMDLFLGEVQLQTYLKEMETADGKGRISLDHFETIAMRLMDDANFIRDDEDKIYRALQVLDREKKGFLMPDELKQLLTTEGETFSPEEIEELLTAAVDPFEGKIFYDKYAIKLSTC